MKAKLCQSTVMAYVAYLKSEERFLLGASQDKKVLKYYLENNRHLNKSEYHIDQEDMISSQYYIEYNYIILEEAFDGVYIPKRDLDIIERDCEDLSVDISHTIENLQKYAYLLNHIKKEQDDIPKIIDSIKVLDKILKKEKLFDKVDIENYKSHPILYCNMTEYMIYIKAYYEEKDLNRNYKRSIE